jgi:pimeloyl-ACP methyl ester carboxylesterase
MKNILIILIVVLIGVAVIYVVRNPEKEKLTKDVREHTHGSYVKLSQGVTHYELSGPDSGEYVVLVHGFSVPYYIWDSVYTKLVQKGYRVLRYDLYGRGFSDRPDVAYDENLYDTQLTELLDTLKVTLPIHLVGLSFGGPVTSYFTVNHSEKVNDLTLFDPVSSALTHDDVPESLSLFWTKIYKAESMVQGQYTDFFHPENFSGWDVPYREQMKYEGFLRSLISTRYHFKSDPLALFQKIHAQNTPVLLIWGEEDHTTPFAASDTVVKILHPEFLAVSKAGHLPHMEETDVVVTKLQSFLDAHRVKR